MQNIKLMSLMLVAAVIWLVMLYGCASSPMQARLDKNFVYACTLQLLEKKLSPENAEKLCTASHRAEMEENKQAFEFQGGKVPVVATAAPVRELASSQAASPAPSPSVAPDAETAPALAPILPVSTPAVTPSIVPAP